MKQRKRSPTKGGAGMRDGPELRLTDDEPPI